MPWLLIQILLLLWDRSQSKNQAGLIAAMSQNNFGEAAFFANENAALARRAQLSSAAIGYAALSYDTGFRAMGIDPGGSTTPLIALDPSQGSIPVPTAEGLNFLRQYNTQIVEAPNANVWGFTTALSLRETGQAFEGSLLLPDSNGLSIDLQQGIFVRPLTSPLVPSNGWSSKAVCSGWAS